MNLNIDAAKDALLNPSEQVKETLAGASDEAKVAIQSILPEGSSLNGQLQPSALSAGVNGSHVAHTARLQVVDQVGSSSPFGSSCTGLNMGILKQDQHFT